MANTDSTPRADLPQVDGVTFLPVVGFPGYAVGDDGSVWSCWVRAGFKARRTLGPVWKQLLLNPRTNGYRIANLCRDGRVIRRPVHQLVLEAFVGPCPEGMECCHFPDRTPANNRLDNLRWDTKKANMAHKVVHGTSARGEANPNAKLTSADVAEIRRMRALGVRFNALAAMFKVQPATISLACKRSIADR